MSHEWIKVHFWIVNMCYDISEIKFLPSLAPFQLHMCQLLVEGIKLNQQARID